MSMNLFEGADIQSEKDYTLPDIVVYRAHQSLWLDSYGEITTRSLNETMEYMAQKKSFIVLNKYQYPEQFHLKQADHCLDLLELFAFVYPAQFVTPITLGIAKFFDLPRPENLEDELLCLYEAIQKMLQDLQQYDAGKRLQLTNIAEFMEQGGWGWADLVIGWLGIGRQGAKVYENTLKVWDLLPEWEDMPPPEQPLNNPLTETEVRNQLQELLGQNAEFRGEQEEYALSCMQAMQPVMEEGKPHIVLAEAGTGTGKTLGYIAASSIWSAKNKGSIWLSTYTKNLQRQLYHELQKLDQEQYKIVMRKGRENYFCLYNYDYMLHGELHKQRANLAKDHGHAIGLGLIARWLCQTKDGDMVGGDFPAWLIPLLGAQTTTDLSDQRGECIYSACSHYKKCFIERIARQSTQAHIVVSNHALTLYRAARGAFDEQMHLPSRYVFDEGHHLFDATDQVFSAHFTAREAFELRRWILGNNRKSGMKTKGLRARIEDLINQDDDAMKALSNLERAAHKLPSSGWQMRLKVGQPQGVIEQFLGFVRAQTYARNSGNSAYGLETECFPLITGFQEGLANVAQALRALVNTSSIITHHLREILDKQAASLDTQSRSRLESICINLGWRIQNPCGAWLSMIDDLSHNKAQPDGKISWFAIEKIEDMEFDCGMHQHSLDPTEFLAKHILTPAAGTIITSATLREQSRYDDQSLESWQKTIQKNGGKWLDHPPQYYSFRSPFDYAKQAKLIVVNDVNKNDPKQLSSAFRELFLASGGGALGLFTAISRLKQVYHDIASNMEQQGLNIYAQHISKIDTGTLLDIFREDVNSCLLGTDATRDGVDVPGRSLRLLVLERVPWPRPTILHKARREWMGGRIYDEEQIIANLRQAWGRLIRNKQDKGVFVILDSAMPSRFEKAFPEGVEIMRTGLADTLEMIAQHLQKDG